MAPTRNGREQFDCGNPNSIFFFTQAATWSSKPEIFLAPRHRFMTLTEWPFPLAQTFSSTPVKASVLTTAESEPGDSVAEWGGASGFREEAHRVRVSEEEEEERARFARSGIFSWLIENLKNKNWKSINAYIEREGKIGGKARNL